MRSGLVPGQMEDKWFIYWQDDVLYFHRSWTGFCVYVVRFEFEGKSYRMVEADLNRERSEYGQTNDDHDAAMISYLIDVLLLDREAEFPTDAADPGEAALEEWGEVGRAMLDDGRETPDEPRDREGDISGGVQIWAADGTPKYVGKDIVNPGVLPDSAKEPRSVDPVEDGDREETLEELQEAFRGSDPENVTLTTVGVATGELYEQIISEGDPDDEDAGEGDTGERPAGVGAVETPMAPTGGAEYRGAITPVLPAATSMTQTLILEAGTNERQHRQRLGVLSASTDGKIRVASAYVTDRDFFNLCENRERRLLTSLNGMDIASGATSVESLRSILESGVAVRILPTYPRFHAKAYMFGDCAAVVTSANLTRSALESNIEVGAELSGAQVISLCKWFDALWASASELTVEHLSNIAAQAASLRREYARLRAKAKQSIKPEARPLPKQVYTDAVSALFDGAERFFVINTNRRHDYKTSTGGFGLEEKMNERGLATAWEDFKFPSHMEQVEAGDAIFAFAKGVGIIGIGAATAGCEVRDGTATDRLPAFDDHLAREWRVPTKWLVWVDAADAMPYKSPHFTFWNVSGNDYAGLRRDVAEHFLQ